MGRAKLDLFGVRRFNVGYQFPVAGRAQLEVYGFLRNLFEEATLVSEQKRYTYYGLGVRLGI